jgi:uncharacterized protein (TIGR00255 family)
MLHSMTGFGRAEGNFSNKKITVEIRSLNSKSCDLNVRMSSVYREKELSLRSSLSNELRRGKIECSIYFELQEGEKKVSVNRDLLKQYHQELAEVNKELGIETSEWLPTLMRLPDVMHTEKQEFNEEEWIFITSLIEEAKGNFLQFREQEGKSLETDLLHNIAQIGKGLEGVTALLPARREKVKSKLRNALAELSDKNQLDENRFEQELIYYLEKLDISEEETRLKNHLEYFVKTVNEAQSEGKKLGFIAQEIGREVNTIGSKANDVEIQQHVVGMKDDLEKIKEQILNVL